MSKLPKWAHYGLLLLISGGFLGGLLVLVNSFTAPIIAENEIKEVEPLLKEVASASTRFEVASDLTLPNHVNKIYYGYLNEQINTLIYWTETPAYGNLVMKELVAIDIATDKIIKVIITSNILTTHGKDELFVYYNDFFDGRSVALYANKQISDYDNNDDEIISTATVSSKGVVLGVIAATTHYLNVYKDGLIDAPLSAVLVSKAQDLSDLDKFNYVFTVSNNTVELVVSKTYTFVSITHPEYQDLVMSEVVKKKMTTYIDSATLSGATWTIILHSQGYHGVLVSNATVSSAGVISSFTTDLDDETFTSEYNPGYTGDSFAPVFSAVEDHSAISPISGATLTTKGIIAARDLLYSFIEGGFGQ